MRTAIRTEYSDERNRVEGAVTASSHRAQPTAELRGCDPLYRDGLSKLTLAMFRPQHVVRFPIAVQSQGEGQ